MHWWCTEYDMMLLGQVSDLDWRFYGGRINGDKTWRQPTTDNRRRRQGEYRAICLWKMDWQSFAMADVYQEIELSLELQRGFGCNYSWEFDQPGRVSFFDVVFYFQPESNVISPCTGMCNCALADVYERSCKAEGCQALVILGKIS